MATQEVAEFACTCERYVGTQSGGMDQAISMMGASGIAKLISFNPVSEELGRHAFHGLSYHSLRFLICLLLTNLSTPSLSSELHAFSAPLISLLSRVTFLCMFDEV